MKTKKKKDRRNSKEKQTEIKFFMIDICKNDDSILLTYK